MKKTISIALACVLLVLTLSACVSNVPGITPMPGTTVRPTIRPNTPVPNPRPTAPAVERINPIEPPLAVPSLVPTIRPDVRSGADSATPVLPGNRNIAPGVTLAPGGRNTAPGTTAPRPVTPSATPQPRTSPSVR